MAIVIYVCLVAMVALAFLVIYQFNIFYKIDGMELLRVLAPFSSVDV
jgi:hypothetical protein